MDTEKQFEMSSWTFFLTIFSWQFIDQKMNCLIVDILELWCSDGFVFSQIIKFQFLSLTLTQGNRMQQDDSSYRNNAK